MIISKDFKEFLGSLDAHHVRYLIVGGYAVAFHGHPRYTKDLDVWVDCSSKNVKNLLEGLKSFGFDLLGLTQDDFKEEDVVIQLGQPPNRIDLLCSIKGVDFESCYSKKETIEIESVKVHFLDIESLKINKISTGRHQDLADVENLSKK